MLPPPNYMQRGILSLSSNPKAETIRKVAGLTMINGDSATALSSEQKTNKKRTLTNFVTNITNYSKS